MHTPNQKMQRHILLYERTRISSVSLLLLAVFYFGLGVPTVTAQNPRCIPDADGVPYISTDTPVWWNDDGDQDFPEYAEEDDRADDPRWQGAYGYGHGGGTGTTGGAPWKGSNTASQVQFRTLHRTTGGTAYLYLSWVVKVAPTLDSEADARAFVGFHQSGGGDDVILELQRTSNSPTTPTNPNPELNSNDIKVLVHTPNNSPNGWSENNVSSWVDGAKARMWTAKAGDPSPYKVGQDPLNNSMWAIQVRIPLEQGGNPTSQNPQVPIDPSKEFSFWYETWVPVQTGGGVTYVAQYPLFDNNYINKLNPSDPLSPLDYPGVGSWPRIKLTNSATAAGCKLAGVSLSRYDIGTTNTPPNQFKLKQQNQPNTLFAAPTNQTGGTINAGDLAATFRIANWGSQPWSGSLQNPEDVWKEIPNGVDVQNASNILDGQQGNITFNWDIDQCTACEFQNYYSSNTSWCNANCTGLPSPKRTSHQCMLVELENNMQSSSLTFLNRSVYRNMDLVQTSMFKRKAAISVRGLGDSEPSPGGDERRLMLFEEKQNLYLEADSLNPDELVLPPTLYGQIEGVREYATTKESPRWRSAALDTSLVDLVDRQLPTYRVYAYRKTGLEIHEEDPDRRVHLLRPQTSFGYYAYHSGALEGWRTRLSGGEVERLGPRVHQVSVPRNGRVMVQNTIQAVELGEEPINNGDEIDQRLMEAREVGDKGVRCNFLRGEGDGNGASLPGFLLLLLLGATSRVVYRSLEYVGNTDIERG